EKGYTNIQLKEPKKRQDTLKDMQEESVVKNKPIKPERKTRIDDEVEDDDDFDPNVFVKLNKDKIQQTAIEFSNYKDNTWIIEKYQKDTKVELLNEILINNRGLVESIASRYIN